MVHSIFWNNGPDQIGVGAVHDSLSCLLVLHHNLIQDGLDSLGITDIVSTVVYGEGVYLVRITLSGERGGFCHEMVPALRVD